MSAAFAVQDVGPGWRTVAVAVALGILALAVLARREVVRERQAQRELKALQLRKQMAANARARAARNAAALEQHRAEREAICAEAARREATGPHGVAHLEALANGLVDL